MRTSRCFLGVAECDGYIYVAGGHKGSTGGNRLRTVERYNPISHQWNYKMPMNQSRSDFSLITVKKGDYEVIFAIGGFNGSEYLNSTEYYDPRTNKWKTGPALRSARGGVCSVYNENKIYAIGGHDGNVRLTSVEVLDLNSANPEWRMGPNLNIGRSNHASVVIGSDILVAGGYISPATTYKTEVLNLKNVSNGWRNGPDIKGPGDDEAYPYRRMSGFRMNVVPTTRFLGEEIDYQSYHEDEDNATDRIWDPQSLVTETVNSIINAVNDFDDF